MTTARSATDGALNPLATLPLYEFIPRISPTIRGRTTIAPTHLDPLVQQLEMAIQERVSGQHYYWFSVPPRHFKSETLKHALIKHLLRWPEEMVAYATHTQPFASAQSRSMRRIARAAGLKLSTESNRQDEWEIITGGGLVARGTAGFESGRGFRLIVIDDPFQRLEQAESAAEREKIWNWIETDVMTRLSPDGFLFLIHTRWHPDDTIGRAKKDKRWKGTNLPALSGKNDDVALLPDVWTVDFLRGLRDANPYKFSSLYQGEPRPRGGKVFEKRAWYDPRALADLVGYTLAHGCDLAYTAKSYADKSVLITGIKYEGIVYLIDGIAMRCQAHEFASVIAQRQRLLPGRCRWYCSTTERGAADLINHLDVQIKVTPDGRTEIVTPDTVFAEGDEQKIIRASINHQLATADKFIRAQPVANAWNLGKVLLPGSYQIISDDEEDELTAGEFVPSPDWVHELLGEADNFTGVNDPEDDWIDGLAAMFDELDVPVVENLQSEEDVHTYESALAI